MATAVKDAAASVVSQLDFSSFGKKKADAAVRMVDMSKIHIAKDHNVRKDFGDIKGLAASIRTGGLDRPLTLKPHPDKPGHFLVSHGERRYRALKQLEWTEVPAVVKSEVERADEVCTMLVDSGDAGHKELSIPELAEAFRELEKEKLTRKEISARTGFHIKRIERILKLDESAPAPVKKMLEDGDLSTQAAFEVANIDDEDVQASVVGQLAAGTTAASIKQLAKKAAAEVVESGSKSSSASGSKKSSKTKKKTASLASAPTWRGAGKRTGSIRSLCFMVYKGTEAQAEMADKEIAAFTLGALAYALWMRGDLEEVSIPSFLKDGKFNPEPKGDDLNGMSESKAKQLGKTIKTEAELHAKALGSDNADGDDAGGDEPPAPKKGKKAKKGKKSGKKPGKSMAEDADDVVDTGSDDADVPEDDGDEDEDD